MAPLAHHRWDRTSFEPDRDNRRITALERLRHRRAYHPGACSGWKHHAVGPGSDQSWDRRAISSVSAAKIPGHAPDLVVCRRCRGRAHRLSPRALVSFIAMAGGPGKSRGPNAQDALAAALADFGIELPSLAWIGLGLLSFRFRMESGDSGENLGRFLPCHHWPVRHSGARFRAQKT